MYKKHIRHKENRTKRSVPELVVSGELKKMSSSSFPGKEGVRGHGIALDFG